MVYLKSIFWQQIKPIYEQKHVFQFSAGVLKNRMSFVFLYINNIHRPSCRVSRRAVGVYFLLSLLCNFLSLCTTNHFQISKAGLNIICGCWKHLGNGSVFIRFSICNQWQGGHSIITSRCVSGSSKYWKTGSGLNWCITAMSWWMAVVLSG